MSARTTRSDARRRMVLWTVLGGVFTAALIITVILTISTEDPASEFGSPTVTGEPLPPYGEATDRAIGMPIPAVAGEDFEGDAVLLADDGRPKIVIFLAHWCPHCQAEVPVLQDLVDEGLLPDGIDLIGIATSTSQTRENFPPSRWLERDGWSSPVIVDDGEFSVARAFGLSAFPFWVFVAEDGTVSGRLTGELPGDVVVDIANDLVGGS